MKYSIVTAILYNFSKVYPAHCQQVEVVELGVIIDGGRKCYLKGLAVYNIEKITDEEYNAMENDYDPIEAPPGPYTLQPHNQGASLCAHYQY